MMSYSDTPLPSRSKRPNNNAIVHAPRSCTANAEQSRRPLNRNRTPSPDTKCDGRFHGYQARPCTGKFAIVCLSLLMAFHASTKANGQGYVDVGDVDLPNNKSGASAGGTTKLQVLPTKYTCIWLVCVCTCPVDGNVNIDGADGVDGFICPRKSTLSIKIELQFFDHWCYSISPPPRPTKILIYFYFAFQLTTLPFQFIEFHIVDISPDKGSSTVSFLLLCLLFYVEPTTSRQSFLVAK